MKINISVIISIFQIWILIQYISTAATVQNPLRGYHGAPIIEPYDSVVINVNEGRTIECKGKEPVTWVSEIIKESPDAVEITYFTKSSSDDDSIIFTDDQNLYHSNLELKSVTIDQVGFFYCVFNRSVRFDNDYDYEKEVIDYEASSIYVFVKDTENPLYNRHQNIIFGRQYEPFVIPCKPNSPDVKVELIKDGEEIHYIGTYDPKIGFTVFFSHVEESGYFECRQEDDHDNFIEYHVTVNEQLITTIFSTSTIKFSSLKLHKRSINSLSGDGKSSIQYGKNIKAQEKREKALSAYLKKPLIVSDTNNYAKNGDKFSLTCHVEMTSDAAYLIKFFLPNGNEAQTTDYLTLSAIEHEHGDKRKSHRNLTIHNALDERDQGDYTCNIIDLFNNSNSAISSITFVDKPVVQLNSSNPKIKTSKGKKTAKFHFNYFAYPKASFEWYGPQNNLIAKDNDIMVREKYNVAISEDDISFTIKFPGIEDYGEYTLVAYTDGERFEKKVKLVVSEKPTCKMEDAYVMQGEEIHMKCECMAYPAAEIIWSFQPCQQPMLWPLCREMKTINTRIIAEKYQMLDIELDEPQNQNETQSTQEAEYIQSSEIRFTASQPGTVKCRAKNDIGEDKIEAKVQIVDLPAPLHLSGIDESHNIAIGDKVTLECGAIIYNYTDKIMWLKDEEPVEERDDLHIKDSNTRFSYRKSLTFDTIKREDEGEYKCEVYDKEKNEVHGVTTLINLHEAKPPLIVTNFNQSKLSQPLGGTLTLDCFVSGLPTPSLIWNKDGEHFEMKENDTRISLVNNDMTLVFTVLKPEDSGYYECVAENRIAKEIKAIELNVSTPTGQLSHAIIVSVISIIVLLVLLSLYLCIKVQRKKRQIAELKAAGLANFEEGNIESIDPDVNLDEQADLLPYDKNYEFPREKLKLGKQLGAGAFGVVVKAVAQGIVHYEDETTVAVKMVKKQTDNEVMKALVSELKIMIHLGQHLNVVNLLGAVTKNIAKRELMVIVEYCQFGNLQSFLVKHRPYFIDQVRNDRIDPMIMKNELRWSKNSNYNSYNSEGNQYTPHVGHMPMGVANPGNHMTSHGYVRHSGFQQIDSCNTEATVVSATDGEDSALLSNNSEVQPPWRSNYGMDYKGPARSVCTSDLVCWSFQIARGMEYLSSRKILHGDLAARNILLCDDNIVKICDFGLSKSMYKNDNYKRKGEAPLPFKWLSLEAISDHVFSVYSDIWSYGVVLWELFSLGKVPYTGMDANQELFYKLRDGYRMEKPKYSTQDIYDIMLNCWNAKPESRPLFNELERKLSSFMMDSVKDHYLDLNEPYMQANMDNYKKGVRDYLTSISIPEEEAPTPPLAQEENFYVNNSAPDVNAPSTPDYLSMSPKSGVVKFNSNKTDYLRPDSPTITKNLDTSPKNKKNVNNKAELPEEIPMLSHNQNELSSVDDTDVEAQNSYTDMKFSSQKNIQEDPEYKNIFATNENYVNIPATNKNSSIANPSYITFQSLKERNH
ncbi:vascular endothelial growth factor receptor kdr-like isoform X5 [Chironomus tepperi]|uniref:vascular endothelial growth factor receptor kdr-like isoform X5 n=1 Tax=Chironomus tepperi TaxID=113505 RepID=UPI00391F2D74